MKKCEFLRNYQIQSGSAMNFRRISAWAKNLVHICCNSCLKLIFWRQKFPTLKIYYQ